MDYQSLWAEEDALLHELDTRFANYHGPNFPPVFFGASAVDYDSGWEYDDNDEVH